jgi:hypothetical protein
MLPLGVPAPGRAPSRFVFALLTPQMGADYSQMGADFSLMGSTTLSTSFDHGWARMNTVFSVLWLW